MRRVEAAARCTNEASQRRTRAIRAALQSWAARHGCLTPQQLSTVMGLLRHEGDRVAAMVTLWPRVTRTGALVQCYAKLTPTEQRQAGGGGARREGGGCSSGVREGGGVRRDGAGAGMVPAKRAGGGLQPFKLTSRGSGGLSVCVGGGRAGERYGWFPPSVAVRPAWRCHIKALCCISYCLQAVVVEVCQA